MKRWLYILPISILALCGCANNGSNEVCDTRSYILIKSFDADGNEITGSDDVSEVEIYLFDKDGLFLQSISGKKNTPIALPFQDERAITAIVWGNSKGDGQMPKIPKGTPIDQAKVALSTNPDGTARSPADYFMGTKELQLSAQKVQTYVVDVKRITASINISAHDLPQWLGITSGDFTFRIKQTPSSVDFNGEFLGNPVSYDSVVGFPMDNTYMTTGIIRTFPSGDDPITIEIFHDGKLVYTISSDSAGKPLYLVAGRLLDVSLEFGESTNVGVTIQKWGESSLDQGF